MTSLPLVLITGAAGKTSRAAVLALTEHHSHLVRTRAMVRRDDDRAQALRDAGAEVVVGDMGDLRDLRRAMTGVQRAHFVAPINNNSLDYAMNFAVAAAGAGVEHVVALSQWLSSESHPSLLTRRTFLVDQLLSWLPDVDHTLINVGFFADNLMSGLGTAAQMGMLTMPLGTGRTAFISNEDIGRVVAGVLSNPLPYAGLTLRPTGPELQTPEEIAAVFGEVLGREVTYVDSSETMASKAMRALGHSPFELSQVMHYMRDYRRGSFESGGTTNVVQQVTGRPAEDLATITRRYAASDPMAARSVGNLLRAMAQFLKILLTKPLDTERWQREQRVPLIDGQDCADAPEWTRTHAVPEAFGVPTEPSLVALSS
ncbi:MAG: NmrA family NAD(P)-binding protein [Deltaproteobacteria bacterium]|nr:NmrA family NAD(P)-binding protein [Deltaproteobacteria bacterium]